MSLRYKLYPAGVGVLWGCIIITVRTRGIFKTKQRGRKVIPPLPNVQLFPVPTFLWFKNDHCSGGNYWPLVPRKMRLLCKQLTEITEMSAHQTNIEYPVFIRFMSPVSCGRFSLQRGETDERTPPYLSKALVLKCFMICSKISIYISTNIHGFSMFGSLWLASGSGLLYLFWVSLLQRSLWLQSVMLHMTWFCACHD